MSYATSSQARRREQGAQLRIVIRKNDNIIMNVHTGDKKSNGGYACMDSEFRIAHNNYCRDRICEKFSINTREMIYIINKMPSFKPVWTRWLDNDEKYITAQIYLKYI